MYGQSEVTVVIGSLTDKTYNTLLVLGQSDEQTQQLRRDIGVSKSSKSEVDGIRKVTSMNQITSGLTEDILWGMFNVD